MATDIKLRATLEDGITTVKTLMFHPMDTGLFKNPVTGEPIPEHFITEVTCEYDGKQVLKASCGIAVSKNPYMAFSFKGGEKGAIVKLGWTDNQGQSQSAETTIS